MDVYIAKFNKEEEFSEQHGCDITRLSISLHPVIAMESGKASISSVGVEPVIMMEGKVVDHTRIVSALRDTADMIEKELDGKTAQGLIDDLTKGSKYES